MLVTVLLLYTTGVGRGADFIDFSGLKRFSLQRSWSPRPSVSAGLWVTYRVLFSFISIFPLFLQLCFSSNLPFSWRLLPCWISCGLHRFPAPPSPLSSCLELEAIPEYSMMTVHLFPLSLAYAWACQCCSSPLPVLLHLIYRFSFLLLYVASYRTLTFSPFMSSLFFNLSRLLSSISLSLSLCLHFIFIALYFSVVVFLALFQKVTSFGEKVCCWLLKWKSADLLRYTFWKADSSTSEPSKMSVLNITISFNML